MANSSQLISKGEQRLADLRLLGNGLLHSYSQIFFSIDRPFAAVLLLVSFIDLYAGVSGLLAAVLANVMALCLGFDRKAVGDGVYGFNPLMVGMVMGVYYDINLPYILALVLLVVLTFLISVSGQSLLAKYRLPLMSIPFLFGTWALLLIGRSYGGLELSGRGIYTINELYSYGGAGLVNAWTTIEELPIPRMLDVYFRSVGAIFFQYNLFSGILMTLGLFYFSRIAFVLSLVGFFSGYFFVGLMHGEFSQILYSYIGFNFILSAIALGGFFVVPGRASVLLVLVTSPLIAIFITCFGFLMAPLGLPMYSLPYNVVVILVLHALRLRPWQRWLHLVDEQLYSPEKHLYRYLNRVQRFARDTWYHIYLPFFGEWKVSQGHAGALTHKGDWGHAWDFVIEGADGNTYKGSGAELSDFLCFDRPVLAPQAGVVVAVENGVDENPIGAVNLERNWGNTVVLKHGEHMYTKLSHLRKGSVKVAVGDVVNRGQMLGNCGSSGRSPEPHLHMQVQATPYIGSKTLDHPLAYYLRTDGPSSELHSFDRPEEGWKVSNLGAEPVVKDAFDWIPGLSMKWAGNGHEAHWEVFTDAYNYTYLYCHTTASVAYFVNDGTMFYFTSFTGDRNSLLYTFHLAFYRVLLACPPGIVINDLLPVDAILRGPVLWAVDLLAPLHVAVSTDHQMSRSNTTGLGLAVELQSHITVKLMGRTISRQRNSMRIGEGGIVDLTINGKTYLCVGN